MSAGALRGRYGNRLFEARRDCAYKACASPDVRIGVPLRANSEIHVRDIQIA